MTAPIEGALIRFFSASYGEPIGVGALVDDRHIITCAHVVNSALELPQDAAEQPHVSVQFDCPVVDDEIQMTGRVIEWDAELDIAVLEVDGNLPESAVPVQFVAAEDTADHAFEAYGVLPGS